MTRFTRYLFEKKLSMLMGAPPDHGQGAYPVPPMAGMHPALAEAKAGMFPRQRRAEIAAAMAMEEEDREARMIAAAEELEEAERKERAIAMQKEIADAEQRARIELANETVAARQVQRAMESLGPEESAKAIQSKMTRILSGG